MVAPVNYSPANPFIIGPASMSPQSLSQNMAKLTISFGSQPAVTPILIIEGNAGQQVSKISEEIGSGRVYKLEDLADAKELKRKKGCVG